MAESPNARRERIAEMIYAAMISSSEWASNTNADLYYEARKAADVFLAHAAEQPQPQPTPDGYPTLLEAAKNLLNAVDTLKGPDFFISPAMMRDVIEIAMLRDAIKREEAREHMGVVQSALDVAHLEEVEDELGGLRAEIRRLDGIIDDIEERAWKALGEPEGTYDSTNVQRLCAEVERLRAQLHADDQRAWEALGKPEGTYDTTNVQRLCKEVSLLRTSWERVAHALMAKQKETP